MTYNVFSVTLNPTQSNPHFLSFAFVTGEKRGTELVVMSIHACMCVCMCVRVCVRRI